MTRPIRAFTERKALLGLVVLVTATLVYIADYSGALRDLIFSVKTTTITAVFESAPQLAKGDPVRIDGVEVGRVKGVTTGPQGRSATVEMAVGDEALPLYKDARVELRWRTLLGANFVVDLDRGHAVRGELGPSPIPVGQTSSQVEIDDIAPVFAGHPQTGLRTMLRELPQAFSDHDAPTTALESLTRTSPSLAGGLRDARGRAEGDLTRLVSSTAKTVAALDAPADPIEDLVEGGAGTVAATAAESDAIAATITQAAGVLPRVTTTMTRLRATLRSADPLVADLAEAAPDVAPALAKLQPAVTDGADLLRRTQPLLGALRPTARSLAFLAENGSPVLDGIAPALERLDRKALPDLARRSPESKRTTYEMVGPFFASLDQAFSHFDRTTNFVRFLASGGGDSVDALPCRSFLADPTREDIVSCNDIVETISQLFTPPANRRAGR